MILLLLIISGELYSYSSQPTFSTKSCRPSRHTPQPKQGVAQSLGMTHTTLEPMDTTQLPPQIKKRVSQDQEIRTHSRLLNQDSRCFPHPLTQTQPHLQTLSPLQCLEKGSYGMGGITSYFPHLKLRPLN